MVLLLSIGFCLPRQVMRSRQMLKAEDLATELSPAEKGGLWIPSESGNDSIKIYLTFQIDFYVKE